MRGKHNVQSKKGNIPGLVCISTAADHDNEDNPFGKSV